MVTVYVQDNCAPCKTAKYFLNKKNIEYEEVPIADHKQRIHENGFVPLSPTFEFDGKMTQKLQTVMEWQKV